jgi:hypothetical protein
LTIIDKFECEFEHSQLKAAARARWIIELEVIGWAIEKDCIYGLQKFRAQLIMMNLCEILMKFELTLEI